MSLITTEEIKKKKVRSLLETGRYIPPRTGPFHNIQYNPSTNLTTILQLILTSKYLVVDLETKGVNYYSDIDKIIGIGLAWDTGSIYFHLEDTSEEVQEKLINLLSTHPNIVAHNIYFDGGFLYKDIGKHINWRICTYSLLALLANEGYKDDSWGLKEAMTEFLGWQETNETELDIWLCQNGFYKGAERKTDDPEELKLEYTQGSLKSDKGEMWRAPKDILGKYCILDCEATYLLLTEVLLPVYEKFPGLQDYYQKDFLPGILLHIEQKIRGIEVDKEATEKLYEILGRDISELDQKIRNLPECKEGIEIIEGNLRKELLDSEPPRFRKYTPPKEPKIKTKKDGELSAAWIKWNDKILHPPALIESKNWTKWSRKLDQLKRGELEGYQFNINSDEQLRELVYIHLGNEPFIFTESGLPSTSSLALSRFGNLGSLLESYFTLSKRRSFPEKYLTLLDEWDIIRPNFRLPGTCTGRASSSSFNVQQLPKIHSILSLFKARSGFQFIDLDFSGLEPTVTAEFSRDRNMRFLYEDPSRQNDPYLFLGAQIKGKLGEQIRSTGYDPFHPTNYTIARAKKEVKGIRQICKAVFLGCSYGAGPRKLHKILEEQGIYLSLDEVVVIYNTYWDTFSEVRNFESKLRREYLRNGYILNGLGRPLAICEDFSKDLLNRFIQSTGHDILLKYIRILTTNLTRANIEWYPILLDLHDATTVEVEEGNVERAKQIFLDSLDELNGELGGDLKFTGIPTIGFTLSEVKEPEN